MACVAVLGAGILAWAPKDPRITDSNSGGQGCLSLGKKAAFSPLRCSPHENPLTPFAEFGNYWLVQEK